MAATTGLLQLAGSFSFIFFLSTAVNGHTPTITSLPESLFGVRGGVHSVVEGSVIQLYCLVEHDNAIISWTKDSVSAIIDVPHLRVRTSSNGTHNTSVLTLDNFRSGDNGMYQCHAMSGGVTQSGRTVSLTALISTASGTLVFRQQPTDNERTSINDGNVNVPFLRDNRTAVSLGEIIDPPSTLDANKLLRCVAGHQNDDTMNFSPSTVVWIKDGETVENGGSITISTSMAANGEVSSTLQIASFQVSNVGVYQCIFTDDSSSDEEIITTIPLRLDTGETLAISRVSSELILLRPPEKLVIEVEATGRYEAILWTRNGVKFRETMSHPFFVRIPNVNSTSSELVNYFEIFVREPTTESDFGVYEVQLDPFDPNNQTLVPSGGQVDFRVVRPVNADIAAISGPAVTVLEGGSVNISCKSTGVPIPSITWSFKDTTTPFEQTDIVMDFSVDPLTNPGSRTSVLHIVSASYPDHDGVYTCVGVNFEDANSSAFITVQVQVVPEVEVTSNFPNNRINIGGTITLSCSVIRGNPTTYTYKWRLVGSNATITEMSNTLTVSVTSANQLGTYVCIVGNGISTGEGSITIEEGMPPSVTAVPPASPVVVDSTVELVCVVTGDTPLTITWTHDSGGGVTVFTGNGTPAGNFTLTVNSDDYGSYTCSATNLFGSDSSTVDVVQAASAAITDPGMDTSVSVNETVDISLSCTARGVPAPIIIWSRDGIKLSGTENRINISSRMELTDNSIGFIDVTSTLTVTNSMTSDTNNYACIASNTVQSALHQDERTFTLTVNFPVVFYENPMNFSVLSPSMVELRCMAGGQPSPTITWIKTLNNGTVIKLSSSMDNINIESTLSGLNKTSTLTIDPTTALDTASYRCRAVGSVYGDTDSDGAYVTVYVTPIISDPMEGDVITVNETEDTVITCTASGVPAPPNIQLMRGETVLNRTENETTIGLALADRVQLLPATSPVLNSDGTLMISRLFIIFNLEDEDSGSFTCSTISDVTEVTIPSDQVTFELLVQVAPTITLIMPSEQTISAPNMATISCEAVGRPRPIIAWFKVQLNGTDHVPVSNSNPNVMIHEMEKGNRTLTSTLTIFPSALSDTADYVCVAENVVDGDEMLSSLIVHGPPHIVIEPMDQFAINNGSSAVFTCFAQAFPQHCVSWTFTNVNGETLDIISTFEASDTSKYQIIHDRGGERFGELTVLNVQFSDRGTYNCTAENDIGSETVGAILTVHVTPVIERSYSPGDINISLSAILVCLVTGYPIPSVSWQKNGETIDLNSSMVELQTRIDIFDFETDPDTAIVTGRGFNSNIGSGFNISSGSGSIESLIGMTDISVEDIRSLSELGLVSVLYFEEVVRKDTANYTCTAVNELAETTRIVNVSDPLPLVILERPDPPVGVMAFDNGAQWIALRWTSTFDGNRPVDAFNIYIRNVNETENFDFLIQLNPGTLSSNDGPFMYNISDHRMVFPFILYSFRVVACNEIGCSEQSDSSVMIMTDEDRPDAAPSITEAFSPSSTSLFFSWDPPPSELQRGILTGYRITYYIENSAPIVQITTDTSITLNNLTIFETYRVNVSAGTSVGYGPENTRVVKTLNDTAEVPTNLLISSRTDTTITLTWNCPGGCMSNGDITHFEFTYSGRKSYDDDFSEPLLTSRVAVNELEAGLGALLQDSLMNLTPATEYTITVAAVNGAGVGNRSDSVVGTTETAPPPPPNPVPLEPPVILVPSNVRTETIVLPTFSEVNAPISHYHVFVVLLPEEVNVSSLHPPEEQFPTIDINNDRYQSTICDEEPTAPRVYITTEFGADLFPLNNLFIVGNKSPNDRQSPNDRTGTYTNGELCYSRKYTFFTRAYTDTSINQRVKRQIDRQYIQYQTSGYNPVITIEGAPVNAIPIAVGVVIGVVVIALIVVIITMIVMAVMKKRGVYVLKTKPEHKDSNITNSSFDYVDSVKCTEYKPPDEGAVTRQPIPVLALASHIEGMCLNENRGFSKEYRVILDNSPKHSVENCMSPANKPKNRYANIHCFDHSRVPLTPVEGAEHDYINGNFIEGFNRPKEYIATQGPLPHTINDFWRLVWDYNSPTIVMLTKLTEKTKIKCSQYWPDSGSQQYSYLNVTLVYTITHSDFIIRHFQIKDVNSDEVKSVRQFHFISWPDFGVPRQATPFLHFLQKIRNVHPYSNQAPIVIHCSAGVGRTGTLITIDVELQRAEQERVVDPFNYVLHMRNERNHMVQTEAQYMFLHDAILEGIASGNTEVAVDKLTEHTAELMEEEADGETGHAV